MSSRLTQLLALALLIAVAANALAMQTTVVAPRPHQRLAGCHGHGSKSSGPAPERYQCCQTGHNVAFVQDSLSPQLISHAAEILLPDEPRISARPGGGWDIAAMLSGGSPGLTPLRI